MTSPKLVSPQDMYALAVFCVLEGHGNLSNVPEQLKVAAVIVNRLNSANWTKEFGSGWMDQMFARGQFEVQTRFGLDRADFESYEKAAKALSEAKPGISLPWARELIIAFARAAADPKQYGAAAEAIGDSTGFRGKKGVNVFRKESKYDSPGLAAKQPSSLVVSWGKDKPLF